MGMRCNQFIGLPESAQIFLEDKCAKIKVITRINYPIILDKVTKYSEETYRYEFFKEKSLEQFGGMDGEVYPLFKYFLRNGLVAIEKIQLAPWSSGPMFF